jgi:branched-chain amino acid transport system ATP-binding protein
VNGVETIGCPPTGSRTSGIGYLPEERGIFSSLSVEENLMLPPQIGEGGMSVDEIYEMFPNLRERRKTAQGTQALRGRAADARDGADPAHGAQPAAPGRDHRGPRARDRAGARARHHKLKERGFTIVLVEQNFRFAAPLADRHYVMEHGKIAESFAARSSKRRRNASRIPGCLNRTIKRSEAMN